MDLLDAAEGGSQGTYHVPPSVVVADAAGFIRSANVRACVLFGFSLQELVGRPVSSLMPEACIDFRFFEKEACHEGTSKVVSGKSKSGQALKLRVMFSYFTAEDVPLVCIMLDELEERCFFLTCDKIGTILTVVGNSILTSGFSSQSLIGKNVSTLCPTEVARTHVMHMAKYEGLATSSVVGKVRQRELRHQLGYLVPISLSVHVLQEEPLIFSGCITEIEPSTEAVITVTLRDCRIVALSSNCTIFFGYEREELVGMTLSVVLPGFSGLFEDGLCTCRHKDGSQFFASMLVTQFVKDTMDFENLTFKRAKPRLKARMPSLLLRYDEVIFSGDIIDWYEISSKTLGSGFFGGVKLARHRLTGIDVAIKSLKKKQYEDVGMPFPPREIEILQKLRHPNILRYLHSIVTEEVVYIVTEVVTGGELFDYLSQRDSLPEDECRTIFRQILSAIDYMHDCGVCHRDLKLENVLLDSQGKVKIIDFGLGNFFELGGNAKLKTFCGSTDYAPPECWQSMPYQGPELDVWSMGVILFLLATGFLPFINSDCVIRLCYIWPATKKFSLELQDLVSFIFKPLSLRCSVDHIIQHDWTNDCGRLPQICKDKEQEQHHSSHDSILSEMEELGLLRESVEASLHDQNFNQLTATYTLLELKCGK